MAVYDPAGWQMRIRVAWLRDVLSCPPARRWLWSVYYTGEAYVELHPDGQFGSYLPDRLAKQLRKHLGDETRHAEVFRSLLHGDEPERVPEEEDVGWYCLNHAVPDVVLAARNGGPFELDHVLRYMAFLHALELRSTGDLVALSAAATQLGDAEVLAAVASILPDEHYHAAYTHTAVRRLAPSREHADAVLRDVLGAERRAYAVASRAIFRHLRSLGAVPAGFGGKLRWSLLGAGVATGFAAPRLPLFDRIPRTLVA